MAHVNKLHAGDAQAAHMLCCLAFFLGKYDFRLQAVHIPGSQNTAADNLSCNKAEALEQQLDRFLQEGFSAATRKVYRSGINRYLAFASEFQLPATPITHENLALFVAFLGAQNLSVSTIESYLSALLYLKLMQDPTCANPSCMSPYLKVLLRGIKRVNSRTGGTIRLPITAQLMRRIKSALQIQAKTDPYTPT